MVVVEKEEEELSSETVTEAEREDQEEEILGVVQRRLQDEAGLEKKRPTGKVVGIIRRKWLPCCGIIRPTQRQSAKFHLFLPDNKKLPRVRIETRNVKKYEGQKIVIQIDNWPASSRNPVGHCLKILGPAGTIETGLTQFYLQVPSSLELGQSETLLVGEFKILKLKTILTVFRIGVK
jgi:exosome complex exonuclease DIS3/RRP44